MDLEDWRQLDRRLDRARCVYLGATVGTHDLWRMNRAATRLLQEANAEWVNCRRRGRGSPKFDHLLSEATEVIRNFEAHLMLAKLMHKERR